MIVASETESDDVTWLKNNLEPFEEVTSKWKRTFENRLEWKSKTIEEYFDTFPCLQGPEGYELVTILNLL